ncbi:hypothetical protein BGW42_002031 [Actinomortierella wolfii]|nr:hypothetical protein BGW42_002031 [Actinomortierella wolfii]
MRRLASALTGVQSKGLHTSRLTPTARRVVLPGSGASVKTSRLSSNFHRPQSLTMPSTVAHSSKMLLPAATTSLLTRSNHSASAAHATTLSEDDKKKQEEGNKKSCCSSKKQDSNVAKTSSSCHTSGGSTHHKATVHSQLPTTSLAFWSDLSSWQVASVNTFRCLVGCTVGDFGMLFYLQSYHPSMAPTVAMGLAMASGITSSLTLETVLLRYSRKTNLTWGQAFKTAMGMSMISMLTMEAVENAVDFHLMGWNNVDFSNPAFWQAMGLSAFAGWLAPLPWNYWNFKKRGKSCH